jgi:hypothetical protein
LLRVVYLKKERTFDFEKKHSVVDLRAHSKLLQFFIKKSVNNLFGRPRIHPPKKLNIQILVGYYFTLYCNFVFFDVAFYDTLHLLFQMQSNRKQYMLTFMGLNKQHFTTISAGKLMCYLGVKLKSAKKSKKILKYLVDYFEYYYLKPAVRVTHYLLKPTNRKNLNMFYEIQKYCKIDRGAVGGRLYYASVTKRAARIKKRIKKRLMSSNAYYA